MHKKNFDTKVHICVFLILIRILIVKTLFFCVKHPYSYYMMNTLSRPTWTVNYLHASWPTMDTDNTQPVVLTPSSNGFLVYSECPASQAILFNSLLWLTVFNFSLVVVVILVAIFLTYVSGSGYLTHSANVLFNLAYTPCIEKSLFATASHTMYNQTSISPSSPQKLCIVNRWLFLSIWPHTCYYSGRPWIFNCTSYSPTPIYRSRLTQRIYHTNLSRWKQKDFSQIAFYSQLWGQRMRNWHMPRPYLDLSWTSARYRRKRFGWPQLGWCYLRSSSRTSRQSWKVFWRSIYRIVQYRSLPNLPRSIRRR